MKSFSERIGARPAKTALQVTSMDNDLKNSLWNAIVTHFLGRLVSVRTEPELRPFCYKTLWVDFFKYSLDNVPANALSLREEVRKWYVLTEEWWRIYDLIEFIATTYPVEDIKKPFIIDCNKYLERELSAYRFVGTTLSRIVDKQEIESIESALEETPVDSAKMHFHTALALMSHRERPDYRNSIKESISAVESLARLICRNEKATLGQAIKQIESEGKIDWHPRFKDAIEKLYGYTNDESGVRHSLKNEEKVEFEEAKFMLVTCSAFVNYLVVKADKAGIALT
jgi:hypothetical protein